METTATGWLGGTPPASVVAHFDANGHASFYGQCSATLVGPTPSPLEVPTIVVDLDLVQALSLGRQDAGDADLDLTDRMVGGVVWERIPDRLPTLDDRTLPPLEVDALEPLPPQDVPDDDQPLAPSVLRDVLVLPTDVLLPFVDTVPDDDAIDLELVDPDGDVRIVEVLDDAHWRDLRAELDPTAPADLQLLPVPPADVALPATVLQPNFVCAHGWTPAAFVHLTVTASDGEVHVDTFVQVDEAGALPLTWLPDPTMALGEATVTADDGTHQASDTVEVVPAPSPTVATLGATDLSPGDTVRIGVSGFAPGQDLGLQAYRKDDQGIGWDWVGQLPGATADADGQAVVELVTLAEDPPDRYCIVRAGHAPTLASYCSNAGFDLAS